MKKALYFLIILFSFYNCKAQSIDKLIEENNNIDSTAVLQPDVEHSQIDKIVTRILSRYHYNRTHLNDSLSSVIFDNYISSLDHNKLYFLKSDIEKFEKYRYSLDENLYEGQLDPAFDIFNTFKKRLTERIEYTVDRLKTKFDFEKDEYFTVDREDTTWAQSKDELDELWRQRLKNEALNLKLDGEDWEEIQDVLTKRYKNYHKAILQYKNEDVFQLYMNAFANAVDPHTSYFSPITSDNFKINMSLSLEGIGAQLRNDNGYTTVAKIIPGGPAFKDGRLQEEDKIIAVGQGQEGEFIDVVGWRLDDVVQLIRGDKGTQVRLKVKSGVNPEAGPDTIKIVRDKVKLEEQAAKSDVIEIEENGVNYRFGVLDIPAFYIDFEGRSRGEKDYKSTTRDVKKLITELKKKDIDGIIIDLRNNGGGSLEEAISLTGLFIEDGPVVQVREMNGEVEVGKDPDDDIFYDGPLAVLVNRFSASASEIFSGAIQDYGRGVIIGEQTFGKGTVQNLLPLDRFLPGADDELGQLKLTIAKYYRITGSSTQHMGVHPDVEFPSALSAEEYGESSYPSALPWDKIDPTDYKKFSDLSRVVPKLEEEHESRVKNDQEFQFLLEDISDIREARNKNNYSLNYEKRKLERDEREAKRKLRDELRQQSAGLTVEEQDELPEGAEKDNNDVRLRESGHILADLIQLTSTEGTAAAQVTKEEQEKD